jgi:MYXO-CTERM domain-containing protein
MKRVFPLFGSLILAVSSFAQQPDASQPNLNPAPAPYGAEQQPGTINPYRPVQRTSGGGWGIWGLLGLLGLLGARRRGIAVSDRDTLSSDPRRRVA